MTYLLEPGEYTDTELLDMFRQFCVVYNLLSHGPSTEFTEYLDDIHWTGLSAGFFIAKGATPEQVMRCSSSARYEHEYWSQE